VAGPFTQVSVGEDHTCAVRSGPETETGGDIACWGWNLYGEAPPQVTGPFTQVSASRYHTCGLKTDGSIECWGDSC
jgi:hypothetical protein